MYILLWQVLSVKIYPAHVDLIEGDIHRRFARVKAAHAHVQFANHEDARRAVDEFRKNGCKVAKGAALLYNETPYEGEGGRGWCLVEQGSASVVAAHLAHTEQLGVVLPPRFALAQKCRHKLVDITGGVTRPVEVSADPVRVLKETMESIDKARFTFASDKEMAEVMMNDFEWTIKMAVEEAVIAAGAADSPPL